MKQFAKAMLIGLSLILTACGNGSSSSSGNINGNWTAALTDPNGSPAFAFTTSFTQSSGTSLNVTNFNFTTSSPCFNSQTSQTGSFNFTGNFNGRVTGVFGMTISTMFPPGQTNNVLTLQGNVNGGTVSGTWTLTGVQSGCTGNGSFTVTKS